MGWLDRTRGRYRSLAHRGRELDELDAELRYHFDRQVAENKAAGMPPDEARRAARLTVGDPVLAVSAVLTMRELINQSTLDASFEALVVFSFAAVSLLLAAVGLLLSFVVSQRSKEIGIRFALGAQRPEMLRSMLLDGMRPAFVGVAFGLAGAWAATRLIGTLLYATQPLDPVVSAGVVMVLLTAAAMACVPPAWRASRLDPILALAPGMIASYDAPPKRCVNKLASTRARTLRNEPPCLNRVSASLSQTPEIISNPLVCCRLRNAGPNPITWCE